MRSNNGSDAAAEETTSARVGLRVSEQACLETDKSCDTDKVLREHVKENIRKQLAMLELQKSALSSGSKPTCKDSHTAHSSLAKEVAILKKEMQDQENQVSRLKPEAEGQRSDTCVSGWLLSTLEADYHERVRRIEDLKNEISIRDVLLTDQREKIESMKAKLMRLQTVIQRHDHLQHRLKDDYNSSASTASTDLQSTMNAPASDAKDTADAAHADLLATQRQVHKKPSSYAAEGQGQENTNANIIMLEKRLSEQKAITTSVFTKVANQERRISELKVEIGSSHTRIGELSAEVSAMNDKQLNEQQWASGEGSHRLVDDQETDGSTHLQRLMSELSALRHASLQKDANIARLQAEVEKIKHADTKESNRHPQEMKFPQATGVPLANTGTGRQMHSSSMNFGAGRVSANSRESPLRCYEAVKPTSNQ